MYRVTISPDRILPFHGTNWQRLSDMLHSIKRGWKPEPIYAFPLARYVEECLLGMLDGHHRRVLLKIRGLSVETIVIETAEEQVKLGKEIAVMELGCFLEELVTEMKIDVPQEVLDKLFKFFNKQRSSKSLK